MDINNNQMMGITLFLVVIGAFLVLHTDYNIKIMWNTKKMTIVKSAPFHNLFTLKQV